jgi:Tol biopolymer transport system component
MAIQRRATLAWVDADGGAAPIDLPPALYTDPDVSPDGQLIAFSGIEATSGNADVWIADVARGSSSRLTSGGINRTPAWSPDGRTLFYVTFDGSTSRSTVVARAADGGGDTGRSARLRARK